MLTIVSKMLITFSKKSNIYTGKKENRTVFKIIVPQCSGLSFSSARMVHFSNNACLFDCLIYVFVSMHTIVSQTGVVKQLKEHALFLK